MYRANPSNENLFVPPQEMPHFPLIGDRHYESFLATNSLQGLVLRVALPCCIFLVMFLDSVMALPASSPNAGRDPEAGTGRLLILISDMHLGVGRASDGEWHNYEDARWAGEFDSFLKEMNGQGKGKADLILNGDTFELWQSLEKDCIRPDANLGCT